MTVELTSIHQSLLLEVPEHNSARILAFVLLIKPYPGILSKEKKVTFLRTRAFSFLSLFSGMPLQSAEHEISLPFLYL